MKGEAQHLRGANVVWDTQISSDNISLCRVTSFCSSDDAASGAPWRRWRWHGFQGCGHHHRHRHPVSRHHRCRPRHRLLYLQVRTGLSWSSGATAIAIPRNSSLTSTQGWFQESVEVGGGGIRTLHNWLKADETLDLLAWQGRDVNFRESGPEPRVHFLPRRLTPTPHPYNLTPKNLHPDPDTWTPRPQDPKGVVRSATKNGSSRVH